MTEEECKELCEIAYTSLNEPRIPEVWVMSDEEFNWFRQTLKTLSNGK